MKLTQEIVRQDNWIIQGRFQIRTVLTNILRPINPEAVDGHWFAIDFIDSFWSYQELHFLETGNDVTETDGRFFSGIGKPGTLVFDGAGELNSNDIKQICIKQGVKQKFFASDTSNT